VQWQATRDLVVEANYGGNRGALLVENNTGTSPLGGLNTPNPAVFARYGIESTAERKRELRAVRLTRRALPLHFSENQNPRKLRIIGRIGS